MKPPNSSYDIPFLLIFYFFIGSFISFGRHLKILDLFPKILLKNSISDKHFGKHFLCFAYFSMFRFLGHFGSLVEFLNEKCLHKELLFDIRRLAYYLRQVHHHG
jgi:hypothetical protein